MGNWAFGCRFACNTLNAGLHLLQAALADRGRSVAVKWQHAQACVHPTGADLSMLHAWLQKESEQRAIATAESEQAAAQDAQRKARDKKIAESVQAMQAQAPPAPAKKAAKEAEPAAAKKAAKEAEPAAAKKAPAEAKKQTAPISGNGKDGQVGLA